MKEVNFVSGEEFEKHLSEIGTEIRQMQERPEIRELPEREIVQRAVESVVSASSPEARASEKTEGNLPPYLAGNANAGAQEEVRQLIALMHEKGIVDAVNAAKKKPPFVMDALHDALAKILKERGVM